MPIRLFIILSYLTFIVISLNILSAGYNPNKEYSKFKKLLITFLISLGSRILMFCSGVYWIRKTKKNIADFDKTYPLSNSLKKNEIAPLVVSNHVSWLDSLYYCYDISPSFLAKSDVANLPFIGACAKALQCIFVDREST